MPAMTPAMTIALTVSGGTLPGGCWVPWMPSTSGASPNICLPAGPAS